MPRIKKPKIVNLPDEDALDLGLPADHVVHSP